jgi:predicted RNA-binding protein with PUA domain
MCKKTVHVFRKVDLIPIKPMMVKVQEKLAQSKVTRPAERRVCITSEISIL